MILQLMIRKFHMCSVIFQSCYQNGRFWLEMPANLPRTSHTATSTPEVPTTKKLAVREQRQRKCCSSSLSSGLSWRHAKAKTQKRNDIATMKDSKCSCARELSFPEIMTDVSSWDEEEQAIARETKRNGCAVGV